MRSVPKSVRNNLSGKSFNRWRVLEYIGMGPHGNSLWLCQCSCANKTKRTISGNSLTTGSSMSCGCFRKERVREISGKNLLGQTFGRLTVKKEHKARGKSREILWECMCSCGKEKIILVKSTSLTSGHTKSCGCYNRDRVKKNLLGKKFGFLEAITELPERNNQGSVMYLCKCSCGRPHCTDTKKISSAMLVSGNVKSCGALKKKTTKELLDSRAKSVYSLYLRDAESRRLIFSLSFDECVEIFSRSCHYCGRKPQAQKYHTGSKVGFPYNGIDRVKSSGGYVKGNIVAACFRCNRAKSNLTLETFYEWICRVFLHTNGSNSRF